MYIVAGPPGSGKSTALPVSGFGVDFFNADDCAAQLNRGSYRGIPQSIRGQVNRQFESFVNGCIGRRASFALETSRISCARFSDSGS
jgi:predicted ABC-type ATPase